MIALHEQEAETMARSQQPEMRWAQVLSHLDPKYGGVSTVVPSLANALSNSGVPCSIAAFCSDSEKHLPSESEARVSFWPVRRLPWMTDRSLRASFDEEISHQDGVHIHGLWDATSAIASSAAVRQNKPYVVSSHGMLEPWALQHGKVKKQIYSALLERSILRRARCLHALTEAEALQCRSYTGRDTATVVIPNGVTIPRNLSEEVFLARYPGLRGRRIVLFLARLHPKKGVDLLVSAWRQVVRKVPEAALVLAGPDSGSMAATLQDIVEREGITESVTFTGMLDTEFKWSALCAAECMVLPSHSEGLSMSVLEAMGAGVPVVVTPQCNMPWIPEIGAGWLADPDVAAISDTLIQVLSRSSHENTVTGNLGRRYVEREYSWASVAQRMAEVYRWCLGGDLPVHSEVLL